MALTNIHVHPSKHFAVDFSRAMREREDFLVLDGVSKTQKKIWLQIVEEMNKD